MPTLNNIFQTPQYTQLTSNGSGSLYIPAITYTCAQALTSSTVSCPFTNASSCSNGSATQIPDFSVNYCNQNVSTSSVSLIQG